MNGKRTFRDGQGRARTGMLAAFLFWLALSGDGAVPVGFYPGQNSAGGGSSFPYSGLTAYWRMEGAAWTSYTNGYTLMANNGVTTQSGIINLASSYNRLSSQYLSYTPDGTVNPTNAVTYNLWLNPSDVVLSGIGEGGLIGNNQGSWRWNHLASGAVQFYVYKAYGSDGTAASITSVTTLSLNTWSMLTIRYDGTQSTDSLKLQVYINGVLEASPVFVNTPVPSTMLPSVSASRWGGVTFGASYFTGGIDEVGVWNRALSSTEITKLYNSGAGLAP